MMRRAACSMTTTRRLPFGGLVEVQYGSDGRVRLHVDTQSDVSNVIAEVDRLRAELDHFEHVLIRASAA